MNAPNVLSLSRVAMTPFVVAAIGTEKVGLAAAFLIVALLTDFLDGWLARRSQELTELGKVLDPLADKILVAGVLAALVHVGRVPIELAAVVVFRDSAILAFGWIRVRGGSSIPTAELPGKIGFTVLGVYLGWQLVKGGGPVWLPGFVGAAYFVAGLAYVKRVPAFALGRILKGER